MTENSTDNSPSWLEAVRANLSARPQIVLSGNVRDVYRIRSGDQWEAVDIREALWSMLHAEGFEGMVVYDRLGGIRTYPPDPPDKKSPGWTAKVAGAFGVDATRFANPPPTDVIAWMGFAARGKAPTITTKPLRLAFVVDYASRILRSPEQAEQWQHDLFHAAEKLANARDLHAPRPVDPHSERTAFSYNPIIWIANRERDLPIWFLGDNPRIATQVVPTPNAEQRRQYARVLLHVPEGEKDTTAVARLTDLTDGLPLLALPASKRMADSIGKPMKTAEAVTEAVRLYKLGVKDNHWAQENVRVKLQEAEADLGKALKGQERPIREALDRLKRSAMGLTGAHAGGTSNRPRAVMMLAGPTGVGKTELVRAISRSLFSTDDCIRFDMSEFAAEHTDQRLIGAPPGYVGYDAGGELTNAVRARPFSVLLFDEIEKAHPRILDKFLQILEDGRLTDSHGITTYFSECLIFFTTNKGVYRSTAVTDERGEQMLDEHHRPVYRREYLLSSNMTEKERSGTVTSEIKRYFREDLGRPEIMNRIGPDNVIVFNPITETVATVILKQMLERVEGRVKTLHGTDLDLSDAAFEQLRTFCLADLEAYGGRGIGTNLEATLVNPVARYLFDNPCTYLHVTGIVDEGNGVQLRLEPTSKDP